MEVFRDLPGPSLDLILHSPGGSAEAADRLVRYMRSKYADVRVIVPLAAMSAATMWALGANQIIVGKHSQLGPIDPQVQIGNNWVPASALVRQFQRISDECSNDPTRLCAWLPTLQQYWPGLLEICNDADELGRSMVEEWLSLYMLYDQPDAATKARAIANSFADSERHRSHSKGIDREQARGQGVDILNLEDDQGDCSVGVGYAVQHAPCDCVGREADDAAHRGSAVRRRARSGGAAQVVRQQEAACGFVANPLGSAQADGHR